MHNRTDPRRLRIIRNTLAAIASVLLAYRLIRAAHLSTVDLLTSLATAGSIIGAMVVHQFNRIRQLRHRAEHAENLVALHGGVLSDEEDRALWDSIPAAKIDEDTCAFGVNVVVLDQHRFPRAG